MCTYTIYSSLFLDDDDAINRRVKRVLKEGLNPILCIGETKEEYDAGLAYDVCIYSCDLVYILYIMFGVYIAYVDVCLL